MRDATTHSGLFVRLIGIILFVFPMLGMCDEDYDRCVINFGDNGVLSLTSLQQRAEEGLVEAQYCLAVVYHEGKNVARDRAEAAVWYLRAGQKGHALYALGQWYYGGYGRNKFTDYLNAYIWFSRAVMAGDEAGEDMIRLLERQMTDLQILEAKKLLERHSP